MSWRIRNEAGRYGGRELRREAICHADVIDRRLADWAGRRHATLPHMACPFVQDAKNRQTALR